ncbi:MAG: hypothetical protein AB1403_19765, partial [Candidatus Riflebacteria bacterium]
TFTFCLIFSLHCLILAQPINSSLPNGLNDLLTGKELNFSAVAEELKETDLPTALAVVEQLKFKAHTGKSPQVSTRSIILSHRSNPDWKNLLWFHSLKPKPAAAK